MIAIIVPVLRRPHRVAKVVANIAEVTQVSHRLLFVASEHDRREIGALLTARADHVVMTSSAKFGDYARKINLGFRETREPYVFTGADDLRFHHGWDVAALARFDDPRVGVVGTDDRCNPRVTRGEHSTHSLVKRAYVELHGVVDRPGYVLCELYPHEFMDDELVETAKARGAFAFADDSVVEHLHPDCRKRPRDQLDVARPRRMREGRAIFERRRRLWAT